MMKRRMWSLAASAVCLGMALSVSGHAGWAPQKAQSVASMSSLDLPALKKPITKRFVNAKLTEVLAWLSLEEFSFVADAAEFPQAAMVTLNFRSQPLGAVLDAISDAFGGRWERRGDIFTLRPLNSMTRAFGAPEQSTFFAPSRPESTWTTPPGVAAAPSGGLAPGAAPAAPLFRSGVFAPSGRISTEGLAAPSGATAPRTVLPPSSTSAPAKTLFGGVSPVTGLFRPVETTKVRTGAPTVLPPMELAQAVRTSVQGVSAVPAETITRSLAPSLPPRSPGEAVATMTVQDAKAHQQAMKEVEQALRQAEQEMKRLHESGEWKKSMEKAMTEARSVQTEDHRRAMAEVEKAMVEAHRAMQELPRSAEWKKTWEKALDEIRRALKDGKVVENGKERKMTAQERQSLEHTLKSLQGMKNPFQSFSFVMPKFDQKSFVMPKIDGKAFVMPKLDSKIFEIPKIQGRAFMHPDDPEFAARNLEIRKRIEEMNKRMKDMGGEGHAFVMPKVDAKAFSVPKMKLDPMPELKALERIRPLTLNSRSMKIGALIDSLTSAQKEKHEKQGYLSFSDLNPKQREMLGDIPGEGNWTFSYSIDGKKITIKNK